MPDWNVRITNPNNRAIQVTFSERMALQVSAHNFINGHLRTITIPARSFADVRINGVLAAGFITVAVDYVSSGVNFRRVTYANGLMPNRNLISRHNELIW